MEEITLKDMATMCGGRLLNGNPDQKTRGVSIDSRTVREGEAFLALKGENFDGHDFVEPAIKKGAAAVVGHAAKLAAFAENANQHVGLIEVEDPLEALQKLAAAYRLRFDIPVVVITGSCGKTTTKDMLAAILGRFRKTVATQGNLNNLIGAPLMLLRMNSDTEVAVIEIASNALGEIERLARIINPTMGVITNIGPVHLEGFGSLEGVFREKTSLIPHIRTNGALVIHEEDVPVDRIRSIFDGTIVTFSFKESADFYAVDIRQDIERGTEFLLNGKEKLLIPVLGEHNVLNALAATATATQLGADMDSIAQGLATFSASSMRMQVCRCRGATIINDAYNANPRAMRESISTAAAIPAERRIFAFGDMLELGEHAQEAHLSLGRYIGDVSPDLLYLVGAFRNDVRDGALEAGMQPERIFCFDDTEEVAASLKELLRSGDLLLVKGSRGMRMEKIVQRLVEEE